MTPTELADAILAFLPAHSVSLSLSHNDQENVYETVAEQDDEHLIQWISEEERKKAREINEQWEIRWYPNTPVGFHAYSAASLSALLEWVARGDWERRWQNQAGVSAST